MRCSCAWISSTSLSINQAPDAVGQPFDEFQTSFSMLVLSELARADRVGAYLDAAQRQHLVEAASTAVSRWRDYRGFDAQSRLAARCRPWRRDLLMQLSLNPAVAQEALRKLVRAALSRRSRLQASTSTSTAKASGWRVRCLRRARAVCSPRPIGGPLFDELVLSPRGRSRAGIAPLNRRPVWPSARNTYQFLLFLHALIDLSPAPTNADLAQLVTASLKQLP